MMKVSEALGQFIYSRESEGKSPETVRTYRERIGVLQRWLGSDEPITALTTDRLRRFLHYLTHGHKNQRSLKNERLAPETVADSWRSLHAFLAWLVQEEILETNPLDRVARPKVPPRPVPSLDEATMRKVAEYWNPHDIPYPTKHMGSKRQRFIGVRNRAYVLLSITSALRRGEAIRLDVGDIDWTNRRITVLGKGSKIRRVPINIATARALRVYLEERNSRFPPTGALFVTLAGERITKAAVRGLVARIKEDLRLPKLHPHMLRHVALTAMRRNGLDLFQLQAISGHANLNSMRPYQSVSDEELSQAFDRSSPLHGEMRRG